MPSRRHLLRLAVAAAALPAVTRTAAAQAYPAKPINIIVPFAAGSGTDSVARVLAEPLGLILKQPVAIENKPGANGAIGAAQAARAAPDGYTLFMATNSPLSAAPTLNKSIAYDPVRDFAPVIRVGSYVFVLAIDARLPIKSIPELVAYAKANPGKLSYASGNTTGIVAGETLKRAAGIDMLHVPYKSTPPAVSDVLGGRVSLIISDLTPVLPHMRAGTLRPLAGTRLMRSALIPDVPTLNEAGIANFDLDSWGGLFVPAKTPPDITSRLNSELRRIIDSPETRARLAGVGFEGFSSTPAELGETVAVQLTRWTRMIRDAGIEAE